MMRVNLSVAIVAMVKSTPNNNTFFGEIQCEMPGNSENQTFVEGDFDWNERVQGLVLGSFYWGYILTQIPGGALSQRYGAKWFFGFGVFIPAVLMLLSPVAAKAGAWVFITVRVITGIAEGVTFPAITVMLGRWAPPDERSRLGAITYAGAHLGTVIAMPLSGYLIDELGWESVFYFFGVVAIIWCGCWIYFISETPETHPTISSTELEYIMKSIGREEKETIPPTPWIALFSSIGFWAIIIANLGSTWGFYTLLTELPTYMKDILGYEIKANGLLSSMPYLCNWISAFIFSFIADKIIISKKISKTAVRKIFNSLGFFGPAACLIGASYTGCNKTATLTFLTLAFGFNGAVLSGFMVNHMDQSKRFAGAMFGITNTAGTLCGIVAPYVAGSLTNNHQTIERWRLIFFIAAAIYIVSNIFYLIFGTCEEQPFNNIGVSEQKPTYVVTWIVQEDTLADEDHLKKV